MLRLPGGCPCIERTGRIGTGTSPSGLKAFALFEGGISRIFICRGEVENLMRHFMKYPLQ
jgi:hypothetical protein